MIKTWLKKDNTRNILPISIHTLVLYLSVPKITPSFLFLELYCTNENDKLHSEKKLDEENKSCLICVYLMSVVQHIMAGYSQNTRFHLQIIGTRNKLAFQIYRNVMTIRLLHQRGFGTHPHRNHGNYFLCA